MRQQGKTHGIYSISFPSSIFNQALTSGVIHRNLSADDNIVIGPGRASVPATAIPESLAFDQIKATSKSEPKAMGIKCLIWNIVARICPFGNYRALVSTIQISSNLVATATCRDWSSWTELLLPDG